MSNIKILIFPLLAVCAIAIIWVFIKPLYEETRLLEKVKKPELESLVQQENDLQQRTQKLSGESESNNQRQEILTALPVDKSSKDLVAQIENIATKEKMTLSSISVDDSLPILEAGAGIIGQTGNAYQELSGKFEVKGSYGQFKQLLRDIKKLNRAVTINQLGIRNAANDEGAGVTGVYSVGISSYWQPEITAEQAQMGLENRENVQAPPAVPGLPSTPATGVGGAGIP